MYSAEKAVHRVGCDADFRCGTHYRAAGTISHVWVVVTETVRFFIVEFVHEVFSILVRSPTAESGVVLAIRHECAPPPAVLRRRRAFSRDTYRVDLSRLDRQRGFEAQIVNPAIAEVILVQESLESA